MNARISYRAVFMSQCLLCGRDYHDQKVETCPRCGGLCSQFSDQDLTLLERRQTRGTIVVPGED